MRTTLLLLIILAMPLLQSCGGGTAAPKTPVRIGANAAQGVVEGDASWYGAQFQGRPTASGELYDRRKLTAAHPSYPFGTRVKVTDIGSGRSVIVVVNDRFGGHRGRVIDLSEAAFEKIAPLGRGVTRVRLDVQR